MSIGLLGQKIGMTSVYDANGKMRPVTVIAAGDNVLAAPPNDVRTTAIPRSRSGFDTQKESRVTKRSLGEFKKADVEPKKFVREFRLEADAPEGDIDLKRDAVSAGRFCRRDRSLEGQRLSGRDEEAQLPRPGRGARFEDASAQRRHRQSFHSRSHLEKHGHAGSYGRRTCDRAEPAGACRCAKRRKLF